VILQGACVPQHAGVLPYAPFVAALRQLRRSRGADALSDLLGPETAGALAELLIGRLSAGPPEPWDPDVARSRLFDGFLQLLEAAAARRPAVLLVEDLHWADPPTRDLLTFLLAGLDSTALVVVLTQRPDELPSLTDLTRLANLTRLELAGLADDEVADQLRHLLDRDPEPTLINDVVRRTGGIPLYIEALVQPGGEVATGVPVSLRELLLRPVSRLHPKTQKVIRAASLGGSQISHRLLASVSGLSENALTARAGEAVGAGVIDADESGYRFRHDLIGQAVRDHLLPGDREDIHRRYAEAMERDAVAGTDWELSAAPAVHRLVRIALHWRGAHEHGKALRAAGDAASLAGSTGRPVEQLSMLDLVLQLWNRVPDASSRLGVDRTTVLEEAAKAACWAAEPERGLMLAEAALELLDPDREPERYAAMLLERASMRHLNLSSGAAEDLERALSLASANSDLRRELAGSLARALLEGEHVPAASSWAQELQRLAAASGDERACLESHITNLRIEVHQGNATEVLAGLESAVAEAQRLADSELEAMGSLTLVRAHAWTGNLAGAAVVGRTSLAQLRRVGLDHYYGATLAFETAAALLASGRWADAVDVIEQAVGSERAPHHLAHLHVVHAEAALRRGPLEDAVPHLEALDRLLPNASDRSQLHLHRSRLIIEYAHLTGDAGRAARTAAEVADRRGPSRQLWPALCSAIRALGNEAVGAQEGLVAAAAETPALGPAERAHAATFAAERGRASGHEDADTWLAIADQWQALHRPFEYARALLRAGGALAGHDRVKAGMLLKQSSVAAEQIDAAILGRQIAAAARRIGSELGRPPTTDGIAGRLTDREREVLRLVALGQSNGEIAAELYISRKTASVHVSNILAKLQVSTRGAAAALAHRNQLFDFT
jgi:DNA-binding CsgD family transcriptional regulator/tetratricopeptide (TPR) repeat protein